MRPPKKRPLAPTEEAPKAPRGMWFEQRRGQPLPWLARWRVGKQRDGRAFKTEKERADFADAWAKRRTLYGKQAQHVAPRRLEVWEEFDRRTGGADPLKVADFWLKMRGEAEGNLLVPSGVDPSPVSAPPPGVPAGCLL